MRPRPAGGCFPRSKRGRKVLSSTAAARTCRSPLAESDGRRRRRLLETPTLFAGTSTGAIVAFGLGSTELPVERSVQVRRRRHGRDARSRPRRVARNCESSAALVQRRRATRARKALRLPHHPTDDHVPEARRDARLAVWPRRRPRRRRRRSFVKSCLAGRDAKVGRTMLILGMRAHAGSL